MSREKIEIHCTQLRQDQRWKVLFRDTKITVTIKERLGEPYLIGKH